MFLVYFIFWVILNAKITLEICIFGVVIAGAVFAFTCKFMDYSIEKEKNLYRKIFKFLRYIYVLIKEIVKANYAVIHMILTEEEEVQPVLVSFESPMETPIGKAFLANAITLTPGTITVMLEDSQYMVHCLDESLAEGIDDSVFTRLLTDMERMDKED